MSKNVVKWRQLSNSFQDILNILPDTAPNLVLENGTNWITYGDGGFYSTEKYVNDSIYYVEDDEKNEVTGIIAGLNLRTGLLNEFGEAAFLNVPPNSDTGLVWYNNSFMSNDEYILWYNYWFSTDPELGDISYDIQPNDILLRVTLGFNENSDWMFTGTDSVGEFFGVNVGGYRFDENFNLVAISYQPTQEEWDTFKKNLEENGIRKLQPKTQFYSVSKSDDKDYHNIIVDTNFNVFAKSGDISGSYGENISVGKGQVITWSASAADNRYTMRLIDKKTNTSLHTWNVDAWNDTEENGLTHGASYYWDKVRYATFLGKINGNRYLVVNYKDDVGSYSLRLLNIDTWQSEKTLSVLSSNNGYFDAVFDGDNTLYVIDYQQPTYGDLHTITLDGVNSNWLISDVKNLAGLNSDGYLYYQTGEGKRQRYKDGNNDDWTSVVYKIVMIYSGHQLWSTTADSNNIVFTPDGHGDISIRQAMINNSMIGENENKVVPVLFLDFEDTGTDWVFSFVYIRHSNQGIGWATFSINKETEVVTKINAKWTDYFYNSSWDIYRVINRFSNVVQSYNLKTFYNYGLQMNWINSNGTLPAPEPVYQHIQQPFVEGNLFQTLNKEVNTPNSLIGTDQEGVSWYYVSNRPQSNVDALVGSFFLMNIDSDSKPTDDESIWEYQGLSYINMKYPDREDYIAMAVKVYKLIQNPNTKKYRRKSRGFLRTAPNQMVVETDQANPPTPNDNWVLEKQKQVEIVDGSQNKLTKTVYYWVRK